MKHGVDMWRNGRHLEQWIWRHGGAGKLTYCAFFDKSTNFGTEVDRYIMNKFGGGATADLPPGGRCGHFPKWPPGKWPPADI